MIIRYENLKRRYGSKTVLNLDCGQINHGKITGLIGPNGAGKSTLLNIIAGLDKPSEGQITYGFESENGSSRDENCRFTDVIPREKMTLLFQQPYLIHTTVEKNIAYPLKLRKIPRSLIKDRVSELMEELGLTPLARQRGWRLSGGEMQKAAFARALSFRPELLLMDEPTSNIDTATTAEIERIIKKENAEEGMTMVFVGHNLAQIKRLCDEVIFMNRGKIIESGTVPEILENPREPETRAFVEGRLLI